MADQAAQAAQAAELAALEALFDSLSQARISTYVKASALCALAYDQMVSLDDEVEHIWWAPWSAPKALYLLARYYALAHLAIVLAFDVTPGLTLVDCKAWIWMDDLGGLVIFTSLVNVILFLRIRAIYNNSRKVTIPLAFLMICQFAFEMTVTVWDAVIETIAPIPAFVKWPGCAAQGISPNKTLIAWVPCIVVAFVCAVLTVYRFFAVSGVSWRDRAAIQVSPLFRQFVWDGTLGFVLIFAVNLTTALLTILIDGPLADITAQWLIVVYALAGSKMIINLRISASHRVVISGAAADSTTLFSLDTTTPRFATNPNLKPDSVELMSFASPSPDDV